MTKIINLEKFDDVCGNFCLTLLLPRNVELHIIETEDDLTKVLSRLLKGLEPGEYPFLVINLAPIAYGQVVKSRRGRPKKSSSASS